MAISNAKRDKMERGRRLIEVAKRSLDGRGYFMDAGLESHAGDYMDTGDQKHLDFLPRPTMDSIEKVNRAIRNRESLIDWGRKG